MIKLPQEVYDLEEERVQRRLQEEQRRRRQEEQQQEARRLAQEREDREARRGQLQIAMVRQQQFNLAVGAAAPLASPSSSATSPMLSSLPGVPSGSQGRPHPWVRRASRSQSGLWYFHNLLTGTNQLEEPPETIGHAVPLDRSQASSSSSSSQVPPVQATAMTSNEVLRRQLQAIELPQDELHLTLEDWQQWRRQSRHWM